MVCDDESCCLDHLQPQIRLEVASFHLSRILGYKYLFSESNLFYIFVFFSSLYFLSNFLLFLSNRFVKMDPVPVQPYSFSIGGLPMENHTPLPVYTIQLSKSPQWNKAEPPPTLSHEATMNYLRHSSPTPSPRSTTEQGSTTSLQRFPDEELGEEFYPPPPALTPSTFHQGFEFGSPPSAFTQDLKVGFSTSVLTQGFKYNAYSP